MIDLVSSGDLEDSELDTFGLKEAGFCFEITLPIEEQAGSSLTGTVSRYPIGMESQNIISDLFLGTHCTLQLELLFAWDQHWIVAVYRSVVRVKENKRT